MAIGKVGIRAYDPTASFDTDATAFISAAGLTDTIQKNAVNSLVKDLKSAGLWTKMPAVYPMVGGTATAHKFNLKDPRDLNAAFRLTFNGGWTHDSGGAKGSDANGWAETYIDVNAYVSTTGIPTHLGYYTTDFGTKTSASGYRYFMGVLENNAKNYYFASNATNTTTAGISGGLGSFGFLSTTATTGLGLTMFNLGPSLGWSNSYYRYPYQIVRNASIVNDTQVFNSYNASPTQWFPSATISLNGVKSYSGGVYTVPSAQTSGTKCAFASFGMGLTTTEINLYYRIVEKFQVALGRNTNATQPFYYNGNYDLNTNLFIINAGITDTTHQLAVGTLVNTLKTAGIWSKMKAVYPFVGGTATAHRYNLVNPSLYNLTFNGGWTHTSTGVLPNGTTGYANTNLIPSSVITNISSQHLSYYSRTNNSNFHCLIGSQGSTMRSAVFSGSTFYSNINDYTNTGTSVSNTLGLMVASRTVSSQIKLFKNGLLSVTGNVNVTQIPAYQITLGALNDTNVIRYYSLSECSFSSIGDGLTDAEELTFYNAVQAFQTTLGRQV